MPSTVTAKMAWQGGLKFQATSAFGNTIIADGSKQAGGNEEGAKPTEYLLYGMAGCTGIDVIRILQKQRQEITALEIELIAHQQDEYPKPFHTIEVKYRAKGKNLDPNKLAKAIELSEAKYCVVSQTVQTECKVVTSHEVVDE
ncbi:osmotically inducible protein OsmC [candidate division GN15 bacterium]|nr:osmotically inducible protein OsmC [candidate division GN15 bacterium]